MNERTFQRVLRCAFGVVVLCGCGGQRQTPTVPDDCRMIGINVPGPEDFALDARRNRLIVSGNPRRCGSVELAGIYSIPLDRPGNEHQDAERLDIEGCKRGDLVPHGIALVETDDESPCGDLLFVVNKKDDAHQSIDILRLCEGSLEFVDRISDPIFGSLNDLDVKLGPQQQFELFVSSNRWSGLFGSSVVRCHGTLPSDAPKTRCPSAVEDGFRCEKAAGMRYPNGVARKAYGPQERLFVTSSLDRSVHVFAIEGQSRRLLELSSIDVPGSADNLALGEDGFLYTGAQPKALRFMLDVLFACPSPSEAYRIDAKRGAVSLLFSQERTDISATSSALVHRGQLFMGQIFGNGLLDCPLRERPAAAP